MKRIITRYGVTGTELRDALRVVLPWVIISVGLSWLAATIALVVFDIKDVIQHFVLSTIMPILVGTPTLLPLAIVRNKLKRAKSELDALLRIDVLTELPNRRAFFEQAEAAFLKSDPILLMMIDIDHFKSVNDIHGHDAGDTLLRETAKTIATVVRDAAGDGKQLTARLGGEEFGVLVTGLTESVYGEFAQSVVETVRRSSCRIRGVELRATVSIGIASRSFGQTVGEVLRNADNAVYRAKRLGRDQWRSSSPLLEDRLENQTARSLGSAVVSR